MRMTYWVVESFPNQGVIRSPSVVGPVEVPLSEILNTYLHHRPGCKATGYKNMS